MDTVAAGLAQEAKKTAVQIAREIAIASKPYIIGAGAAAAAIYVGSSAQGWVEGVQNWAKNLKKNKSQDD